MARLNYSDGSSPNSPEKSRTFQHKDEQRPQRQRKLKPLQHDISLFRRVGASSVSEEVKASALKTELISDAAKDQSPRVRATPGRAAKLKSRQRVVQVDSSDDEVDGGSGEESDGEWDGESSASEDEDMSGMQIRGPLHYGSRIQTTKKDLDQFASLTVSPLSTPPPSPSKPRLTSPKKSRLLPSAPHRPSMDAFWNENEIATWTDQYSPQKTLKPSWHLSDGSSEELSPTTSPRKSPAKRECTSPAKPTKAAQKAFAAAKHDIATTFLRDLDNRTTNGQLHQLTAASGGIRIIWSKTLNSTAGRANWRREGIKTRVAPDADATTTMAYRHVASIELAEKVIDDEERLLNVLAHEYCHLANFMISQVKDQPHGASFKAWAARVTAAYADYMSTTTPHAPIAIQVTTKHSYAISYKYAWRCTNSHACGTLYERHSKSIHPGKHRCGACKATLEQIRPVVRDIPSAYQSFVQQHFATIKRELGAGSPHKDVMREVGVRFRAAKETAQAPVNDIARVLDLLTLDT